MHIFPTETFEEDYQSSTPWILAAVVGSAFVYMAISFFAYDWFVQSRQKVVVTAAASSNAIVSSMFPYHRFTDSRPTVGATKECPSAQKEEGGQKQTSSF